MYLKVKNKVVLIILFLNILCSKRESTDQYTQIYLNKRPSIFYLKNDSLPKLEIDSFVVKQKCTFVVVTDSSLTPMTKLYLIHKDDRTIFIDDILKGKQKNVESFWGLIYKELAEDVSLETKKELCQFALSHYYGIMGKNKGTLSKMIKNSCSFTIKYGDTVFFDNKFKITDVKRTDILFH